MSKRIIIGTTHEPVGDRLLASVVYRAQPLNPKVPVLLQDKKRLQHSIVYYKRINDTLTLVELDIETKHRIEDVFTRSSHYGQPGFSVGFI